MPRFFSFPSCPTRLLFPSPQRPYNTNLCGGERFFDEIKATLNQGDYRTGFFKITQTL